MDSDKKLPLQGKRFFIDQKVDQATRKKIGECLACLGGVCYFFTITHPILVHNIYPNVNF